jgi:OmpA-OmpF porin, OOP family
MKHCPSFASALFALTSAATTCAVAQTNAVASGPYFGADLGRASINLKASGSTAARKLGDSTSLKVFGGWRFSDAIGVEAGLVSLGRYEIPGVTPDQPANDCSRLSSVYTAVSGRAAIAEKFGLTDCLGLASGRASAPQAAVTPAAARKTSAVFGLGIDYRLTKDTALTLSYDYHGKLGHRIAANSVSLGIRLAF